MTIDLTDIRSFALETLGCKVNRVESDSFQALIGQHGHALVAPEDAECIIVNTCTVTAEADKKARKTVRSLLKRAPEASVVVTGCAATIKPDMFTLLDSRVKVVDRVELYEALKGLGDSAHDAPLRIGEGFRTRVGIKVQDGCDNACTYCIVHVARGNARSMPFDQIVAEVQDYLDRGVKEIVLTGIDLGSYNHYGHTIVDLVRELVFRAESSCKPHEIPARLRASSLEPLSISDEFIDLLATSDGRICRHLHLPLQSGSNKVLEEMNRPYNADMFLQLVKKLYDRVPTLSLSTDIICGFPGETEEDFERTLELARLARFSKIHVFPYSRREGTPAAERPDQVLPEVIAARAAKLRTLAADLRSQDRARRSGTTELVLAQGTTGLTESYHEIELDDPIEMGTLLPVVLD